MSDANFGIQVSLKYGPEGAHMINLRADDWPSMHDLLAGVSVNTEALVKAAGALPLTITPRGSFGRGGAPGAPRAPLPPADPNAPVTISQFKVDTESRAGVAYNNPKGWVKLSDGRSGSTFDPLLVSAARELHASGKPVRAAFEKNGDFTNLVAIGSAG